MLLYGGQACTNLPNPIGKCIPHFLIVVFLSRRRSTGGGKALNYNRQKFFQSLDVNRLG